VRSRRCCRRVFGSSIATIEEAEWQGRQGQTDGLLLVFIFVELLYAVRSCLRSHEIVAEPFLIVGILAGIKEIVVLSVEAATLLDKGPNFSRAFVEVGVSGGVVLVLAPLAAFVLRERRRDTVDAGRRRLKNRAHVRGKRDISGRLPAIMVVRPPLRGVVAAARVGGADRWPECPLRTFSRC
jgi:uncharacterized membrane protein (DUF373 family)